MATPCHGKTRLFEPYFNQGETTDQRGHRLSLALSVCERCPFRMKEWCYDLALQDDLTRGVWGGKIVTALDHEKGKDR